MEIIVIIVFIIFFIILSFCIGYIKGFRKSKEIDDIIINDLFNKYNIEK